MEIDEAEYLETTEDAMVEKVVYFASGLQRGCFIWTLRLSMGDFSIIQPVSKLSSGESILFWGVYLVTLYMSCIFFLNFIVVEAHSTYQRVSDHLEELIYKEKASFIKEAENMIKAEDKLAEHYPKYLIKRINDS